MSFLYLLLCSPVATSQEYFSASFSGKSSLRMSEPDEPIHALFHNSRDLTTRALLPWPLEDMDLDIDLDTPCSFDQIFASAHSPSFLISASNQPWSPLCSFSDDKPAGIANRMLPATGNLDSATEGQHGDDDKRRQSPSILGFRALDNADGSYLIKQRMQQALRYLKESSDMHVLAQLWAPVKNGDHYVLTTSGQPFVLDPNTNGLHQYRMASLTYEFSVDEESDEGLGLPGRVFMQKLPEWTPNVQYYSSKEYPRLSHALHCNVRGTLALPVFEPFGHSCVGVLELIMNSQKINYAPEVDKVCKALEAVNLKSSEILDNPTIQFCNEGRQNALAEIMKIFTLVCETHKLPLAQTWVPCRHRSVLANGGGLRKSCSSFDGSCVGQVCMSTTDVAFYIINPTMWGFRQACVEHHLLKGQGVAGRAFLSQRACFCEDITQFCKSEYPLVHYARMFELSSSFAICLQSTHTGNDEYVLEFFMPPNKSTSVDRKIWVDSLLVTMKENFQSLKVASMNDIDDGGFVEIVESSVDEKVDSAIEPVLPRPDELANGVEIVEKKINDPVKNDHDGDLCVEKEKRKKSEKKRGKPEKSISLEALQQYFTGSLKDAAKSLGVCPTTMKRICRQHGISRWPSRKINKVNRGLSKLKRIMESVQGAEGTFPSLLSPALSESNRQSCNIVHQTTQSEKEFNDFINGQMGYKGDLGDGSNQSKTESGSREEGSGTPTSHDSYPRGESSSPNDQVVFPKEEECVQIGGFFEFPGQQIQGASQPSVFSIPNVPITSEAQEPLAGLLIEDTGSSHNLSNLCPPGEAEAEAVFDERAPRNADVPRADKFSSRPESESITIKGSYREDIIRFKLSLNSGIAKLEEEVGMRLKLERGRFDVKYLDDDQEWVLLACDADLEECLDICRYAGISTIRLLVNDI